MFILITVLFTSLGLLILSTLLGTLELKMFPSTLDKVFWGILFIVGGMLAYSVERKLKSKAREENNSGS